MGDAPGRYRSPGRLVGRFIAQRLLMKPVIWTVVAPTVEGAGKLKKLPESFVVVANHTSHLDAPLIVTGLPYKVTRYLATGAAADYFFHTWWRRGLTGLFFNAFPVDRTGANPKSMSARTLVERGVPLLVFPEGTRSRTGEVQEFKAGAAAIASSAKAPIVPVAIIGAYETHPRGSSWPDPGRKPVGVIIGEPMYAREGEAPPAFISRVRDEIIRLKSENSERILNRGSASPEGAESAEPEGGAA